MGQTWSNFMDIDIFPNTIDYWGPTGMVFYRNQQARYTFPMGDDDEFAVSLENPDTALTVGQFRDVTTVHSRRPQGMRVGGFHGGASLPVVQRRARPDRPFSPERRLRALPGGGHCAQTRV